MISNVVTARRATRKVAPASRKDSDFFPFGGGLNLIDSPLSAEPGQVQNAINYEMGFEGGYKRIGGYEAFDGRPLASSPDYWKLPVALDKKATWEDTPIGSTFDWPIDQELIRGKTSGSYGLMIDKQDTGGYGTNVLLHNMTFDSSEWDWAAGTGEFWVHDLVQEHTSLPNVQRYQWDSEEAVVPFLVAMMLNTAASSTFINATKNDPISVAVGDMVYVSMLCRFWSENSAQAYHGVRLSLINGTGDPFGLPSSTPYCDFDIERGALISKTDHFEAAGVTPISDKVVRIWARTKMCTTADSTMGVSFQALARSSFAMQTSFSGANKLMFWGAPMAVLLPARNPHNAVNGRDLDNAQHFLGSNFTSITDAAATWTSGYYPDFTRFVEHSGSGSSSFQPMDNTLITGLTSAYVAIKRGDKLYIEMYVKKTAANVEGLVIEFTATGQWLFGPDGFGSLPRCGWDLTDEIVATEIDSRATGPGLFNIESTTIEEVDTDIFKLTMTTAACSHDAIITPTLYTAERAASGDLDTFYTGSGTKYFDMTGYRWVIMPNGNEEVEFGEVITTDAAKNVNTGYLIIAGGSIGAGFEEGETLETISMKYNVYGNPDYIVERRQDVGVCLGKEELNSEPLSTLDASYAARALSLAGGPTLGRSSAGLTEVATPTPVIPPGSGPVRGVMFYDGHCFCFRDSTDGSRGIMWKASGFGWRDISIYTQKINFNAGTGTEPSVGDFIGNAANGISGYVLRVETTSGTWGVDAAGSIWVKQVPKYDGTGWSLGWVNTNLLEYVDTSTNFATINGTVAQNEFVNLSPGGKYEFRAHNFYGADDQRRLYFVNGKDTCFEYNDNLEGFVPVETGMTTDKPTHLAIHNSHLFLSFPGGSIQLSGDGDPHSWTVITGATEIGVGDEVTGFNEEVGNSLIIFTRNKTFVLQGDTRANFNLDDFNINAGAHEWSVQRIGMGTYFDDRGFTTLEQTQRADSVNFQENAQSEMIQPLIKDLVKKSRVKCSHLIRDENIYRCYFDDGRIISIGFDNSKITGHMPLEYPFIANVAVSGEAGKGNERIFVGTDDGEVFLLESGNSFNGDPIRAFIRTVLYHSATPGRMKKYTHARLDGTFRGSLTMAGRVEADFDDPDWNLGAELDFSTDAAGGYWDDMVWDSFLWDKTKSGQPQEKLEVEGTNMSLYLHTESTTDEIHTLRGLTMQWLAHRTDRRT